MNIISSVNVSSTILKGGALGGANSGFFGGYSVWGGLGARLGGSGFVSNSGESGGSGLTWKTPVGIGAILSGTRFEFLKPIAALGSKKGSTLISYSLGKALPGNFYNTFGSNQLTRSLVNSTGTNVTGRVLGRIGSRFIPIAGWALLGYDLYDNHDVIQGTISSGVEGYLDYQKKAINGETDHNGNPYIFVCFAEGTLVKTSKGLRPVEQIKVNDLVYSYNITTQKIELSRVLNTFNREVSDIYNIFIDNITISVTEEHPFYVVNKGWTKVRDLKKGDILKSFDEDKKNKISNIQKVSKHVNVYNIEVNNNHNYYASEIMILVHNKNIEE